MNKNGKRKKISELLAKEKDKSLKDLIDRMLQFDFRKWITIDKALEHRFFKKIEKKKYKTKIIN